MSSEVRNNPALSRFELSTDGTLAFMDYRRFGDRIALIHTEVPEALSGRGVGSRLVRGVLDRIRADGVEIIPRCEFVASFIKRHSEYRNLVAED
jgi:predicted GNAT family acetyltransferase